MMVGLCDRFHALPDEGGILDQDISLIRWYNIIRLGHGEAGPQVA